ncbi:hypothetical protein AB1K83_17665 [Sporosarcina sp. 179-K 3D1 HS]|uniref:hypothetical protein n=1 Tax=Sporosarcina sp. 179-K 3D1 HS TaxID=3232169 RepID=UPI0039A024F3
MELPIKKVVSFTCPNCNEKFSASAVIQDLEHVSSAERGMGTENQYDFSTQVQCTNCKHGWDAEGELWEYPSDTINLIEIK